MKKIAVSMLILVIALPLSIMPAVAATTYTTQQINQHNTVTDCWTIVNGQVYNITNYIAQHPGGASTITRLCGINGSSIFNSMHSSSVAANSALTSYYAGGLIVNDIILPSVSTDLNASLNSNNQVVLSWNASTDNVAVNGYKIMRNGVVIANSNIRVYIDKKVKAGTTYTYSVSAFDAAGNVSAQSVSVSVTTLVTNDTILPSVPTGLSASLNTKNNKVILSWNNSTDNVAVNGYKIMRNGVVIANSNIRVYIDKKVKAGATYTYSVSAFDAAGNNSAASMAVSIMIPVINVNSGNKKNHDDEKELKKELNEKKHSDNGNHFGENHDKDSNQNNSDHNEKD